MHRYLVIGAGRQGVAAAYDLARYGQANTIFIGDVNPQHATEAVERISALLKKQKLPIPQLRGLEINAQKEPEVATVMKQVQVVLSAAPAWFNPTLTRAAVAANVSFCDIGEHVPSILEQTRFNNQAKSAGITIVPGIGLAPGLVNVLSKYGMTLLDRCRSIKIYCGGLPQKPKPPLGYKVVYHVDGLLELYLGKVFALKKGKVVHPEALSEWERLKFLPPLGTCEAVITSGGMGTCPWTFEGKLDTYIYKTIRYPGHFEKIKLLRDLGLLDTQPVEVNGSKVVPRKLLARLVEDKLSFPQDKDLVVVRVVAEGKKGGKPKKIILESIVLQDDKTSFPAMERTTGFSAAICAHMIAKGDIPEKEVVPPEISVPPKPFIEELKKRGISIKITNG